METSRLPEFSRGLTALIGRPTDLRPFVCEGSPLECDAFLVGTNPARRMSVNLWDYWSDCYGFDKRAWFDRYKEEGRISNTRIIIEEVVQGANPVKCLETNVYAKATKQASDLDERSKISTSFDYLLRQIAPKLVIAHGKKAARYLQARYLPCELMCVKHFRFWSKRNARELGRTIRRKCEGEYRDSE